MLEAENRKEPLGLSLAERLILVSVAALCTLILIPSLFIFGLVKLPENNSSEENESGGEKSKISVDDPINQLSFGINRSDFATYCILNGDYLLSIEQNRAVLMNPAGAELKNFETGMSAPLIQRKGKYTMAADFKGINYLLMEDQKLIYSGSSEEKINSIALSHDGYAALCLEREGTKGVVRVMDKSGKMLFEWESLDSIDSGSVIGAVFSSDTSTLAVSMLNLEREKSLPIVSLLSLNPDDIGKKLMSFVPTEIGAVTVLAPKSGRSFFAASSQKAALLDFNKEADKGGMKIISMNRIRSAIVKNQKLYFLGAENKDEELGLFVWDGGKDRAERLSKKGFSENAEFFRSGNESIVICDREVLNIFAPGGGSPALISLPGNINDAYVSGDGVLLYVSTAEVRRLRY